MLLRNSAWTWMFLFLVIYPAILNPCTSQLDHRWAARKRQMREKVRKMFYHAYDNYLAHAFPHDELKPLTKSFTDSLSELGNLKLEHLPQDYKGSALTLVESLSSLVILGNNTEFERAVLWLSENLTFNVDARINLFECNIRVLGGLVSAHILATDSTNRLVNSSYRNELLFLAEDLGKRFLPAFSTPTGLPYAWINLKGFRNRYIVMGLSRNVIVDQKCFEFEKLNERWWRCKESNCRAVNFISIAQDSMGWLVAMVKEALGYGGSTEFIKSQRSGSQVLVVQRQRNSYGRFISTSEFGQGKRRDLIVIPDGGRG